MGSPQLQESPAQWIARDPERQREFLASLTQHQKMTLLWEWQFWARPKQLLPPGAWENLVVCAGRGFGKTRMGAEAVREWAKTPNTLIALVGRRLDDVRWTMIEGESGILACCAPYDRPLYEPGNKRLVWPNGSQAFCYSAERPDQLRGPQHHKAWCDEYAAWRFLKDTWDNLQFGLRLGELPQTLITTTPRPLPALIELIKQDGTELVQGKTSENAANLAKSFIRTLVRAYGGSKTARQEMDGEILDATEGALWTMAGIHQSYVNAIHCKHRRAVVAVDPAAEDGTDNDETGIVVVLLGSDGLGYVVEDLSGRYPPETWGALACEASSRWDADIVIEINTGGQMARRCITASAREMGIRPTIHTVRAKSGKKVRAEPAATLYAQRRVKHIGSFPKLEMQMISYVPHLEKRSPDRLDALVYALIHLFFDQIAAVKGRRQKPKGL